MGEEEAERKMGEQRRKRERNMIWRGVESEDEEKRLWLVEEILKRTLRREVGKAGRKMSFNYGNGEGEG